MPIAQMKQVNSRTKTRTNLALICAAWLLVIASRFRLKHFVCPPPPEPQPLPKLHRAICQSFYNLLEEESGSILLSLGTNSMLLL